MPHKQACIMLAKFSKHPSRRMQLERVEKGRFFNDLNETLLRTALASHPQLELLRVWNTEDVRNDCRGSQSWLNAIVHRCGSTICDDLLDPERLWSRQEVLSRPSPISRAPGVYAWYFRNLPPQIPTTGCTSMGEFRLLYVGISPSAPRDEPHTAAQIAWACRVRNVAGSMTSPKYSKTGLSTLVGKLPKRSRSDQETLGIPAALSLVGVRLVIVGHLSGTRIDGGALWLAEVPVVALSLRYDRVDWFWFTLMHELAHILEHEGSLDTRLVGNDADQHVSQVEERADKRATEWLVPPHDLQAFADRNRPYFSRSAIEGFADRMNIHPGIVVGQLQKRGDIPYSHHRNLLAGVRQLFTETE